MPDEHYVNPRLAALYDLDSGWSEDRDFYVGQAGPERQRIVDFGCGTGLVAAAYAQRGHAVTGVDPAPAMLDIARRRPGSETIEWVEATAASFRSIERFDLAIMTGHAFQVLLTDDEIAASLSNIRAHLAPGGRFVFESRHPAIDWAARWAAPFALAVDLGGEPVQETRHVLGRDGDRLTFQWRYAFPDTRLVSTSTLRFLSRPEIEARLVTAGFVVDRVTGDWHGGPFTEHSEEMIFFARPA